MQTQTPLPPLKISHRSMCTVVAFLLSFLLALLLQAPWFFAGMFISVIAGKIFSRQDAAIHQLFPGVFDFAPPTNIDAVEEQLVDLYDCDSCTFLGTSHKQNIANLLIAYKDCPELLGNSNNDFPLCGGQLDIFEHVYDQKLSLDFIDLVNNKANENPRDLVTLRWLPSGSKPVST